ncbi:MAG: bifunctional DNA-formamidopyrimidine glycosylase/DNA-(apurinic or apyrimidinic site) lyase [Gammaproteobacteria bacterium]|nr:bifunctional DNA-formamidopyrimidine glycosylase/DNA-(apurinic or apyrimidinic site) lyase [Gammaproteobacteria bacterium]MDH3449941.1 bifunctional DNA-formamidopyrimidine glycosylase/DNA-(apurinic or apyrimidinic site) lyase [Gammaproteobacteria bacterium]
MPELPEVETTRRGIEPHVVGEYIDAVILRETRLRWPISREVASLQGRQIRAVDRRAKYLIMRLDKGSLIWHLGMSGSMRILPAGAAIAVHEHVEMQFSNGQALKFRDPRRFGALLYCGGDPLQHRLLQSLGPEPLGDSFNTEYLHRCCRQRSAAIKTVLMNSHVVVGVGNIYASEALFRAGIRPTRAARRISKARIGLLVDAIRETLSTAIEHGGTTLQDFTQANGKPGYFRHELRVYGNRDACQICRKPIRHVVQGQRSSYYCPGCQS